MGRSVLKTILHSTVILGCFVIHLPMGVLYYYGNLSTYTDSYFRYFIRETAFGINPDWFLSLHLIALVLGTSVTDVLTNRFDIGLVTFMTCLFFDLGLLSTYFSVQHSSGLTLISFILCCGFTFGMMNMLVIKYAKRVMPERIGLAGAIVTCAVGIGSFINNNAITTLINPDNLTPDIRLNNKAYFSQARVLDNVPRTFIVMGISSTVLHLIGLILQQLPFYFLKRIEEPLTFELDHNQHRGIEDPPQSASCQDKGREESDEASKDNGHTSMSHNGIDKTLGGEDQYILTNESPRYLKPLEVIKTKSFYQLCLYRAVMVYCGTLSLNYYKAFGQLWIKDDNFLASIGSSFAVSNTVIRISGGMFADRFGMKNALVSAMSINAVLLAFWYLAPSVDRWLYFFCCQILIGAQCTMYLYFPLASMKLYGEKYFSTNHGHIMIASLFSSLVTPLLFSFLQENYGQFPLVFVGSVSAMLTVISMVVFMPADTGKRS